MKLKNTAQDGKITALETADTTIRTEFAAADATTLQAAKTYADGVTPDLSAYSTTTQVDGKITTAIGNIPDASNSTKGLIETATISETTTGTDATRATTPAGVKAAIDAIPASTIASDTITTAMIKNNAVTGPKIAAGSISEAKLTSAVTNKYATKAEVGTAKTEAITAAGNATYDKATIDSKDSALGSRLDAYDALPNTGVVKTEQLTFYHDPNRIGGTASKSIYQIIDILKGVDGPNKTLFTTRQENSFVSADNFMPLTTEDIVINGETHQMLIASFPGNILDYTYLVLEFNDSDVQLSKSESIPIATIANGYDWVISDGQATEVNNKKELRVRIAYDAETDTSKVKFHQEPALESSSKVWLFISYLIKETAKSATQVALDDYSLTTDIDAKDTAIKDAAIADTDSKLESYYTKTESNSLNADLQAAINTKEDSTHIFTHLPNYFTGGFIGGPSGYITVDYLFSSGSLVEGNDGKITIDGTKYDIEVIFPGLNSSSGFFVFGIHPDEETETLSWFADKKIVLSGEVDGAMVEYTILGSTFTIENDGFEEEAFISPYTDDFTYDKVSALVKGLPFTLTITDADAEVKMYASKYDTIISDDAPINDVGFDGMTWIKNDGSNAHIRINGEWKPKTNPAEIDTKISAIKIVEKSIPVFANSAIEKEGGETGGWNFTHAADGADIKYLKVPDDDITPANLDTEEFNGISIQVPKTRWETADKIVVTATHGGQIFFSHSSPVYISDLTAGESNKVRVKTSGESKLKINLYLRRTKIMKEIQTIPAID